MDNRWVDGWIMDDGALILVDVFIHVHKKEKTSPIKVRQCKLIKDVFSVAADNGGEIGPRYRLLWPSGSQVAVHTTPSHPKYH